MRRRWVRYAGAVALVALVVVLAVAWLVRRGGEEPSGLEISPGSAARGDTVVLRFEAAHNPGEGLTFERDGETHLLSAGRWSEVDPDQGYYVGTTDAGQRVHEQELEVPGAAEPGTYRVCTLPLDGSAACAELTIR